MNGDLSLSQALGGLRIANPDDATQQALASPTFDTNQQPTTASATTEVLPYTQPSTDDNSPSAPTTQPPTQQVSQHHPSGYSTQAQLDDTESHTTSRVEPHYPSRHPSQRESPLGYSSSRGGVYSGNGPLPIRRSSKGMAGGHKPAAQGPHAPFSGDAPVPTTSAEWQERGAAVGVRREVDANGRTIVRQVKKGVRDFSFSRVLGEGSYSSVYLATDRQTLKEYAVKVLEKRHIIKEKKIKYVNIEKNTLNRLTEHPGIVRLYYTFQDETSLYYVLDLCSGGELLGVLKKTGSFDLDCTRFYSAQILDSVEYMHSRGVIHRDLKPENVLLDDQMHVKITDFGTAKLLTDPREARNPDSKGIPDTGREEAGNDGRAASFVGTAEYVSPELLTNKNACKASDLWAFGCIVYQLLAGRPPFKAGSEYLTFQKIVNLEYDFPPGFPPAARDLIERLLVLDPARRLTIEHIKNHEFFDGQTFGKSLWRTKAPRLRPYIPSASEPAVIQLNGASLNGSQSTSHPHPTGLPQVNPSSSSTRPSRIITELPPPTQLDIEWSPVLTKPNERILRLGDLMVISSPLPSGSNGKGEDGHKKLSRFFGGSTTKKRQRLVIISSGGRIIFAPAGGEDKRTKQELSLLSPDCSWKTQRDAKGQLVWCVDTGGQHYTFEDTKNSSSVDEQRASADEWVECLERACDYATSQNMNPSYNGENGFGDMTSAMSSPSSSTLGGRGNGGHEVFGVSDRYGRGHMGKSQVSLDDPSPAPKRNRFSKRQSRNGLESAF
ncbi:3-phosphoinositide dependent protein kinase-1 [Geosmithia morbida]|uniref:non-specific serine/threonine protein kinase n=1 Tax=Geosmithia morbida TaxID=1094350 RepID=A0A9P4Z1Y8_9HYPO|nr:3-phosphoinositide dependent protein kinase-1 [Geosmithia morbida]KAF4125949.1 3-phosphoinositide dependent protein kinase-1 [Geosmithia morbida]